MSEYKAPSTEKNSRKILLLWNLMNSTEAYYEKVPDVFLCYDAPLCECLSHRNRYSAFIHSPD